MFFYLLMLQSVVFNQKRVYFILMGYFLSGKIIFFFLKYDCFPEKCHRQQYFRLDPIIGSSVFLWRLPVVVSETRSSQTDVTQSCHHDSYFSQKKGWYKKGYRNKQNNIPSIVIIYGTYYSRLFGCSSASCINGWLFIHLTEI